MELLQGVALLIPQWVKQVYRSQNVMEADLRKILLVIAALAVPGVGWANMLPTPCPLHEKGLLKIGAEYHDKGNRNYTVGSHHPGVYDADAGEHYPFVQACNSMFPDLPECKSSRPQVEILAYSPSSGWVNVRLDGKVYQTSKYGVIVVSSGHEEDFEAFLERTTGQVIEDHDGAKWVHYPKQSCEP
ncbi:hypothetical protein [Acetobacter okinawensis]|uniref:hypothetical protein n=1 Tax=Acetobacter okinawensis TaxID=1076594 RepID=UPI00047196F5|nr:hypothetical protein [Acetobacter okinawensis]